MKLTFHDSSASPASYRVPALTIAASGTFTVNAALVEAAKLKPGYPALLAEDEQSNWYLIFADVPGQHAFKLRQRDPKGTPAMQFAAKVKSDAYYEAQGLNPKKLASINLPVGKPVKLEGLTLWPLAAPAVNMPAPAVLPVTDQRPDEATMHRLNQTVRTLAGLQLHKRPQQELTKAYGLLSKYREWVGTIAGGMTLLDKLTKEVG